VARVALLAQARNRPHVQHDDAWPRVQPPASSTSSVPTSGRTASGRGRQGQAW